MSHGVGLLVIALLSLYTHITVGYLGYIIGVEKGYTKGWNASTKRQFEEDIVRNRRKKERPNYRQDRVLSQKRDSVCCPHHHACLSTDPHHRTLDAKGITMTEQGLKAYNENRVAWIPIPTSLLYSMLLGGNCWYRLIAQLPKCAEPCNQFHYEWIERRMYVLFASPEFEIVPEGQAPSLMDYEMEVAGVSLDTTQFPPVVTFNRGGADLLGLPNVQTTLPFTTVDEWPWAKAGMPRDVPRQGGTPPEPQNGPNEQPKP